MDTYRPDILNVLRDVLDEAWSRLPTELDAVTPKSDIAHPTLKLAGEGIRDLVRLRAADLVTPVL